MTDAREVRVPANQIRARPSPEESVAVVGTPNSGKSTLFNRLTGLRQRIANYPGVTVERHVGTLIQAGTAMELIDLPGTHGLSPHSLEEQIAVDVIFGRMPGTRPPGAILAILDATNLYQGLCLVEQLLELGLPVAVALTMVDAAEAEGRVTDIGALAGRLGVPVYPVVASTGKGVADLARALVTLPQNDPAPHPKIWPELTAAAGHVARAAPGTLRGAELERLLIDGATPGNAGLYGALGPAGQAALQAQRERLFGLVPPLAVDARIRYAWVRDVLVDVQGRAPVLRTLPTRIAQWFNLPVPGTLGLFAVMAIVFQAVFAWATPFMDLIDAATVWLGGAIKAALGSGAVASLLADGVVAGVGSVVIFLPQILILFTFILLLEDTGYLARAAYLLDRAMRAVGLSGQSIIPMISSFACAVPGIMATRVIPNRRDRIATIIAAPFMTCSARLPVYALLIAAFVPRQSVGVFNLQGLVLFGLYMFGIVMGVLTALLIRKTAMRGPKPPFALMLPEFRRPNLQTILIALLGRVRVFLYRAGTVIFAVAVIVWALSYFPRSQDVHSEALAQRAAAMSSLDGATLEIALERIDNEAAARQLEQSALGRAGHWVEPAFRPLGWDWRVSAAVIAGFPAREVVIAVLGTIYAVGDEADEVTLSQRLKSSTWPDGRRVFTLPMVVGLLIFYACCLQCAATLAVIRRETNSWRWPVFAWAYMTSLGYLGALAAYQIGT